MSIRHALWLHQHVGLSILRQKRALAMHHKVDFTSASGHRGRMFVEHCCI